jgi:thymidylate kinase
MNVTNKGKYYVLEGPSGVGKTTIAQTILEKLTKEGVKAKYFRFDIKSIDFNSLGSKITEPLLIELLNKWKMDEEHILHEINPLSITLLNMGAKIDLFHRYIKPLIEEGYTILADRFWWSSCIFGKFNGIHEEALAGIEKIYKANAYQPDIVFNLSRKSSFKCIPPKIWNSFLKEYACFSEKGKSDFNVINISNEEEISATIDIIYAHIKNNLTN